MHLLNELRLPPGILPGAPPDGRAQTQFCMCHRELSVAIELRASFRSSAPKAGAYVVPASRLAGKPFHVS